MNGASLPTELMDQYPELCEVLIPDSWGKSSDRPLKAKVMTLNES